MNVEELSASSYCLRLVIMMARTRICSGFRPQTNEFDEEDAETECGWVRRRLVEGKRHNSSPNAIELLHWA